MIKIKLTTTSPEWPIERQTPESKGVWKNFQFFTNQNIEKSDYWVVFGGLKKTEEVICTKENTIFVATEPKNIKKYNTNFLRQFETIISSASKIKHQNIIQNQQASPWMIGCESNQKTNVWENFKNYDELKKSQNIKKEKLISVVTSNKSLSKEHLQRLKFVEELKKHFGEKIDVFGKGINKITDKWDAIAPYKYHIVIENCLYKDHFSEKLTDTFLGESYPIYYGCPNIYDYFSKNSLSTIDISKPEEAIKIIENIINNNQYEKSKEDIIKAKKLVLDKYNFFPMICDIIENKLINKNQFNLSKKTIKIKPESFYLKNHSLSKKILNLFKYGIRKINIKF